MYENIFTTPFKGMQPQYKMDYEKKTVIELRNIAKQSGLVRYTRLRKAELIAKIEAHSVPSISPNVSLLDASVPDIGIPTLKPIPATTVRKIFDKTKSAINTFAKWIEAYVPEEPKRKVNEKLEALKAKVNSIFAKIHTKTYKIRETASAINGFTKQYTVEGAKGIDATSFLDTVHSTTEMFSE